MTGQPVMSCRWADCDRDDLSPQGHKSHETHCSANPNPGVPYDVQDELGLESKEGATTEGSPNPGQSVSEPSGGSLPDVQTLGDGKSSSETGRAVRSDGGERTCPVCGHDDVLDAADAKEAYIEAVEKPNPKAVLGYDLAEHACQNPECAALWGPKYDDALPMSKVVNA